jgi:hypothetical protein
MVFVYQFLVYVSHPCGDSPIDIHLSQEERVGRIKFSERLTFNPQNPNHSETGI